jgi:16S rRNA (guanine966-N2)-methyltransferase
MRIVAGQLKRRKLLVNPGSTTRPITDRAKVMLFDHIRDFLPGQRVLDVFSGTGSLGFEALSRGAKSVVFCEQDHRAHSLLVQNAEHLGVTDRTLCWRTDCLRCSFKAKGTEGWHPYGIIFFDPPYHMVKDLKVGSPLYRSLSRLTRDEVSVANTLMVFRTPTESLFHLPEAWQIQQVITLGSMDMHLCRKVPSLVAEPQPDDDTLDADDRSSDKASSTDVE